MGQGQSDESDSDIEEEVGTVHREVGKKSTAPNVSTSSTTQATTTTDVPPVTGVEPESAATIISSPSPATSTTLTASAIITGPTDPQQLPHTLSPAVDPAVDPATQALLGVSSSATPSLSTPLSLPSDLVAATATTSAEIANITAEKTGEPVASPPPAMDPAVIHLSSVPDLSSSSSLSTSSTTTPFSSTTAAATSFPSSSCPSPSNSCSSSSFPPPSCSSLPSSSSPLPPMAVPAECPVCRLEGVAKQYHKIEFCPTLTELKIKKGSGATNPTHEIHSGPWYHSFHQHPLTLREKGTVMKIVDGVNCDHCGKGCSQTQYHCCNGCNFDLCPDCVAAEIGPNGPFDPEFSRSCLTRLASKEYKLGYDEFREFLSNVDSEVKAWTRSGSSDIRDMAIVPRDTANGDLNKNRQVLMYQISTKRLFPRMSFEQAAKEPAVDPVALGRLNGFQDFGAWSQKGDFIYMVWSREAIIDEFLPGPGLISLNTAASVWNAIRPF